MSSKSCQIEEISTSKRDNIGKPGYAQQPALQLLWGKAIQGEGTVTILAYNQLQH
jgi:hypothetical protein